MRSAPLRSGAVLALAAGSVLLTACGPSGPVTTTTTTTPTPTPTSSTHPEPVDPRALLLTGTIEEAPRPQCVVLLSGATRYLLLGMASRPPLGRQVRVIGVVQHGLVGLCPGVPLRVRSLRPAP